MASAYFNRAMIAEGHSVVGFQSTTVFFPVRFKLVGDVFSQFPPHRHMGVHSQMFMVETVLRKVGELPECSRVLRIRAYPHIPQGRFRGAVFHGLRDRLMPTEIKKHPENSRL